MTKKIHWGILGTGNIAKAFARGLSSSHTGRLVAVGSRTQESADQFGEEFGIARCHPSYEALIADDDVDAVYIATPHPWHAHWSVQCAKAGKHILCEKPATLNCGDTMAVIERARQAGVFFMEAFMYRCHPQTARLVDLIRAGAIGEVRLIQATFSFHAMPRPDSRLLTNALGGGGILDVGCYPASMARLIAGAALRKPFADPIDVQAMGHLGADSGIDEWAVANLRFPHDIVAQLSTGVQLNQDNSVRIYGSEGWIHLDNPWLPARDGGRWSFRLHRKGESSAEEISGSDDRTIYGIEADCVAAHLDHRQAASPAMSWADTLGNMAVLDQWRRAVGVVYPDEDPKNNPPPAGGRAPRPAADHRMKFGRIAGVDKPISRLVMGVDNQPDYPFAAAMFDDFVERGGNAFDTAWIYGRGRSEQLLGHWIRNRGVRDEVVILDKGAHTPFCTPDALLQQFEESLERLQTDYVDLYALHRDNPEVPVGEFVDALNSLFEAGKVRAFGGSNWSVERVDAANDYAARHGKRGFSLLSNQFSLARMVAPVWAGCISASDAETRAWLAQRQIALFPWSSQARGFFTERADPEKLEDEELVRCWYSEENFLRRDRAYELARKHGVEAINIALAYVLAQPFPTFTLIGPRKIDETRSSLVGLDVNLSPEEVQYLDLELDSLP